MAGKGLFNKLIDTFNTVADDARRQLAPKDAATRAPGDQTMQAAAPTDDERAVSHMESARQVASDSGRQVAAFNEMACRHCSTPIQAGMYCTGCGAPPA
jgi:hypothetical protein